MNEHRKERDGGPPASSFYFHFAFGFFWVESFWQRPKRLAPRLLSLHHTKKSAAPLPSRVVGRLEEAQPLSVSSDTHRTRQYTHRVSVTPPPLWDERTKTQGSSLSEKQKKIASTLCFLGSAQSLSCIFAVAIYSCSEGVSCLPRLPSLFPRRV